MKASKRKSIPLSAMAVEEDNKYISQGSQGAAAAFSRMLDMGLHMSKAGFDMSATEVLTDRSLLPLLRYIVSAKEVSITDELALGLAQQVIATLGSELKIVKAGSEVGYLPAADKGVVSSASAALDEKEDSNSVSILPQNQSPSFLM